MRKETLKNFFDAAIKNDAEYVGVLMSTGELIVNRHEAFEEKLDYYLAAYDYKMRLIKAPDISIVDVAYANTVMDVLLQLDF